MSAGDCPCCGAALVMDEEHAVCSGCGFWLDVDTNPHHLATLQANAVGNAAGKRLRELGYQLLVTMRHAKKFIESREKMHPDGIKLYQDDIDRLANAIAHGEDPDS